MLTSIAKFILLALLFPIVFPSDDLDDQEHQKSSIEHDVLKGLVSMVDIFGLYLLFNAKKLIAIGGEIEIKVIAIGLGWAAAELATSNFLDIIF